VVAGGSRWAGRRRPVGGGAVAWRVTVSRPGGRGGAGGFVPTAAPRKVRAPQGEGAGESQGGATCRIRATESRPPMAGPAGFGCGPHR